MRVRIRRAHRAMTIIEVVLVLAMMAILATLLMPQLDISDGAGVDQQAQTTANAALDTALNQLTYSPDATGTVNVSPDVLHKANGDVAFVGGSTVSSDPHTVSIAASGTKIAVAVAGDPKANPCWYAWRDTAATPPAPVSGYFTRVGSATLTCDASTALTLARDAGSDTGSSWASAQRVS